MYRSSARQRVARKRLVRSYRGASTTRSALRFNRIMRTNARVQGRGELKSVDGISGQSSNVVVGLSTSTVQTFLCNGTAVGTNYYNRIGRRIEMASLHLKGVITQTGNVTTVTDYCRLAVVYDRQCNGSAINPPNLFADIDSSGAVTGSTPSSGLNPDERERYLILADIKLALPATTTAGLTGASDGISTTYNINRYIKLNGLLTHYSGDTDLVASISTGSLYVIGMGNLAAGSAGYHFVGTWRLRYADT